MKLKVPTNPAAFVAFDFWAVNTFVPVLWAFKPFPFPLLFPPLFEHGAAPGAAAAAAGTGEVIFVEFVNVIFSVTKD